MNDFSEAVFSKDLDLHGGVLVEASAGTGKTYSMQNLFLRLVVAEGIRVEKILVVTFTDAATHELCERLRNILYVASEYMAGNKLNADDNRSAEEYARVESVCHLELKGKKVIDKDDDAERRLRVYRALQNFDSASISTLHGFCQRVLDRHAFECGEDADLELLNSPDKIRHEVCADAWRKNSYAECENRDWMFVSFSELDTYVKTVMGNPTAKFEADSSGIEKLAQNVRECIVNAKEIRDASYAEATNDYSRNVDRILDEYRSDGNQEISLRTLRDMAFGLIRNCSPTRSPTWKPDRGKKCGISERYPIIFECFECLSLFVQKCDALKFEKARKLADDVNSEIHKAGAITFDSMLTRVKDAVCSNDKFKSEPLLNAMRDEYDVAMVDEFQDTDNIQLAIFKKIFLDKGKMFFMVGDPKQSIYSFRSGDIFTYFGAKSNVKQVFSLVKNFRSEENMVGAVNELFTVDNVFLTDKIIYTEITANGIKPLLREGAITGPDPKPLKIWQYNLSGNSFPAISSSEAECIVNDTVNEIVRILKPGTCFIGDDHPLGPADIAILVRTHKDAGIFLNKLLKRGVNAVRKPKVNLFKTQQSAAVLLLMQALLDPGRVKAVRSVLASGLLPCTLGEIASWDTLSFGEISVNSSVNGMLSGTAVDSVSSLESWMELFGKASELWGKKSFMAAYASISKEKPIEPWLIKTAPGDPDEAVSYLRQLLELIQKQETTEAMSPRNLCRWLTRLVSGSDTPDESESAARPASDAPAVSIMTLEAAKGLEFPVVFIPTEWARNPVPQRNEIIFKNHDADNNLVLGTSDNVKDSQVNESRQEDIRKAYVALTRASHRAYLVNLAIQDRNKIKERGLTSLLSEFSGSDHIEVKLCTFENQETAERTVERTVPLNSKTLKIRGFAEVIKNQGKESFSSLKISGGSAAETVAEVSGKDYDKTDNMQPVNTRIDEIPIDDIFLFNGGERTGNCWHEIMESIDFTANDAKIKVIANNILEQYGLCKSDDPAIEKRKYAVVIRMIRNTLEAKIMDSGNEFSLHDVSFDSRRSEFGFNFPLMRSAEQQLLSKLAEVLQKHWLLADSHKCRYEFVKRLAESTRHMQMGFMTGSIDLLFEHNGRFHIIDWKSNSLEKKIDNFSLNGIEKEMCASGYYLQYMIYTVAANGFLQRRVKAYDYEKHFGGVHYYFLRGLAANGMNPVFNDRLSAECVRELTAVLCGSQKETE